MRQTLLLLACLTEAACLGTGVPDLTGVNEVVPTNGNALTAPAMSKIANCGLRNGLDTSRAYALVNVSSKLALTRSDGADLDLGGVLQPLTGGVGQQWVFLPFASGSTRLLNGGMVLGLRLANPGPTTLWADGGNPEHEWSLNLVDADTCVVNVTNLHVQQWMGAPHEDNLANTRVSSGAFDDATFDHLWQLVPQGAAWPDPIVLSTEAEVTNPSLVKNGNTYLLYSDGPGITVQRSLDRLRFAVAGRAFNALPTWVSSQFGSNANVPQPSVSLVNGQYVLLHSAYSTDPRTASIGVAFSLTGQPNTFIQARGLFGSGTASATYPHGFTASDGTSWIAYGLGDGGLGEVGVDANNWALKPDPSDASATLYRYHGTRTGSSTGGIFAHNGYVFRFATYFETPDTQHIAVTRAATYYETYKGRDDISEFQSGGTIILSTHGRVLSPGHPSVFSDTDGDYLVYDYQDAVDGKQHLGMNRLTWAGDWPAIVP